MEPIYFSKIQFTEYVGHGIHGKSIMLLDLDNRNIPWRIGKSMYAFAYVNDIRDIRLNGRTVDNASNMRYVQVRAALSSNAKDITSDEFFR